MIKKYASAIILDARMGSDAGFAKGAHRAVFNYVPKPGFLYVRSRAISSRCNDNFDMFPAEEIEKSYLTFIGKPVFVNHHNSDHRKARGVVIDAALHRDRNPDGSPDTWVEVLHEVDALTYPKLAKAILAREVNRTSMGCDVAFSKCSVCDNVATTPLEYCAHIPGKKGKRIAKLHPDGTREARLVFEICSGLSFFENSLLVEPPADPTAFFLGDVEMGSGLEHMAKTASSNQYDDHEEFMRRHPEHAMDPDETAQFHRFNLGQDGPGYKPAYRHFEHLFENHGDEYGDLDEEGTREYRAHREHYDREPGKSYGPFNPEHWSLPHSLNSKAAGWGGETWSEMKSFKRGLGHGTEDAQGGRPHSADQRLAESTGYENSSRSMRKKYRHGYDSAYNSVNRPGIALDAAFHPASPTALNEAHYVHENNETDGYDSGYVPGKGGIEVHDYPRAISELRANWQIHDDNLADDWNSNRARDSRRRREVGKLVDSLQAHHQKESTWMKTANKTVSNSNSVWSLLRQAEEEEVKIPKIWKLIRQADLEDDDLGPSFVAEAAAEAPIWDLIRLASFAGDDLYEEDFRRTAAIPKNNAERHQMLDEKAGNGKGVRNLLDLVHKASGNDHELHSGMTWYDDAHGMAKTISEHHRQQEGHLFHGLSSEEALHRTAGTVGVYSSSSAPAPNLHMAMDAIRHGQAVYSKPIKDENGKSVGNSGFNPRGEGHDHDRRGLPMADDSAANKINGMLHHGKTIDEAWKGGSAHKTHNFAHLINDPNAVDKSGKDRVVVDRHAIAAVLGHKGSSGEVYDNPNGPHFASILGTKGGYDKVADMYREAAHHINSSDEFKPFRKKLQRSGLLAPGESVRAHHVQALTWVQQKKISGSRTTTKDQQEIDRFQGSYAHRYGEEAHKPKNWQGFAGGDDRHDRVAFLHRLAYGETKAPQDVDTLRSENCTVCGNSTAFDGVQCQVCGYMAPPRPFGDPDTDTARNNDIRKQVLDSDTGLADPNDPSQQLGNQIGNPGELEDQAAEAEAGDDPSIGMLTCQNCGTGIQPTVPKSVGGEPPYPAEGDICPVCQKGELAAEGGEEPTEDVDGDGVPDEEEDIPGPNNPADESGEEEEDADEDQDEEVDPRQKGKAKK